MHGAKTADVVTPSKKLTATSREPWLASVAILVALTVVAALAAAPMAFSTLNSFDDEGYLLLSLREFARDGSLYTDVYSNYGPAFHEVLALPAKAIGFELTHDSGRLITVILVALTALGVGLAAGSITRKKWPAIIALLTAFGTLLPALRNPVHPGNVIALAISAIVCLLAVEPPRRRAVAGVGIGLLLAFLLLVKVNVGIFALASLAVIGVQVYPALRGPLPRIAIGAAFLILPTVLMVGQLDIAWVLKFTLHVSIASVAFLIVSGAHNRLPKPNGDLVLIAGSFVAGAVVILLIALATGSSLTSLVDGIVLRPLRQADVWSVPYGVGKSGYVLDFVGLAAAIAYRLRVQRYSPQLMALFKAGVGFLLIAAGLSLGSHLDPLKGLAFAWVIDTEESDGTVIRPAVAALVVLQSLHAYPGAGPQVAWGGFLLSLIGVVCFADAARIAAPYPAAAAFAGSAILLGGGLARPLLAEAQQYAVSTPIALPGAHLVRVPSSQAVAYHWVVDQLNAQCSTFVTLPGLNSLYLFTGQRPPTGMNTAAWMYLFEPSLQEKVVASLHGSVCSVTNPAVVTFWQRGRTLPEGPLLTAIHENFEPLATRYGVTIGRLK